MKTKIRGAKHLRASFQEFTGPSERERAGERERENEREERERGTRERGTRERGVGEKRERGTTLFMGGDSTTAKDTWR